MSTIKSKEEEITEKINKEINEYREKIKAFLTKIKLCSDNFEKKYLYNKILNIDNTNEQYVLDYLKCIKEMTDINEFKKEDLEKELNKYEICLSDSNYNENFKMIPRINARQKFLNFINYIKDCTFDTNEQKTNIIFMLNFTLIQVYNHKFNNKKKITWENEELYLNYLYGFLVYSICNLIIYFNKVDMSQKYLKDEEFKRLNDELEEEIKKQKKDGKENGQNGSSVKIIFLQNKKLIYFLLKANFFRYLCNIKIFLQKVNDNFQKKFQNLKLDNMNDKLLFEDYINFLGTYKFDYYEYYSFWNETFVQLNINEKKRLIDVKNTPINIELLEEGKKLKISDLSDSFIIDGDKYDLTQIISDAIITPVIKLEWKLNKYLKPNYYKEELFVCKTKEHWKKLLIYIFQNKTYTQVRDSLFTQTQIDIFKVEDIISEVIDNVKFFIYNTTFLGNTNKETNTIYEYGNYNIEIENKSVALLIFYGFHIIINIHEIGGHLNVRYQYYISLNDKFDSPEIRKELEDLYTSYAVQRNKESGETIEIALFGKVKYELTIKEALFILNKENYTLEPDEFKKRFLNCNNNTFEELIKEDLKEFLLKLEINFEELNENDKTYYVYPLKRKVNQPKSYNAVHKQRHPMSFYYDDPKLIEDYIKKISITTDKGI
jgi:hypothetical protein